MGAEIEEITLDRASISMSEHTDVDTNEKNVDTKEKHDEEFGDTSSEATLNEEEDHLSGIWLVLITIAMMLGLLSVEIDRTIVSTIAPTITSQFNSLDSVGWYGGAYLLTYCSFLPILGQVYFKFTRYLRPIFIMSMVIFEAGSIICATAKSSEIFIFGRAFAGLGGAGAMIGGMNVVCAVVPLRKRALYFACISSMTGAAALIGPPLGGVITDSHLTWRWCFWINPPLGAFAMLVFALVYKKRDPIDPEQLTVLEKLRSLDVVGAFTLLAGMVPLLLALQWGGSLYSWGSPKVWPLLVASAFVLAIFVFLQIRRGDDAMFPPRIIRIPTVAVTAVICMSLALGQYVHIYFLPIYFQSSKGLTATRSGILLLAYLLSDTFSALGTGTLVTLIGRYKPFVNCGTAIFAAGAGILFSLYSIHSVAAWEIGQLVTGTGMGMAAAVNPIVLQAVLPPEDHVTANMLIVFTLTLGGVLGSNIGQTIFSNSLSNSIIKNVPGVDPQVVENAGAVGFRSVVPPESLPLVRQAFEYAVSRAFIMAIATGGVAFLLSFIVKGKNLKKKEQISEN